MQWCQFGRVVHHSEGIVPAKPWVQAQAELRLALVSAARQRKFTPRGCLSSFPAGRLPVREDSIVMAEQPPPQASALKASTRAEHYSRGIGNGAVEEEKSVKAGS
jgi:hypothetical protein